MNRLDLLSAHVPRYTSYPTAPHFHAGIGADTYRTWLGDLGDANAISLYVHIPFCDTLCWFCGCHTKVVNNYSPVQGYLGVLKKEIDLVSRAVTRPRPVKHLHWGGGSPTLLAPGDIDALADALRSAFAFAPDAEFAIEIDPRGLSHATVTALAAAGVTRASIGVQDCDPIVQKAINRVQRFSSTKIAVERLRAAGITKINIDVMYGLPHQTAAHVIRTLDEVLTLEPDRLAVFGYAHVPSFKKHQALIPEEALPGAAERFAQFEAARAILTGNGFVPIGLDHFARPLDSLCVAYTSGRLHRNFQGYTTDRADVLIGFGASSIGTLPQGYVQNLTEVPQYRGAIESGRLPIARGIALSDDDRVRRDIIEELMCYLRVDVAAAAARYGRRTGEFDAAFARLEPLVREGLIQVRGPTIEVNPNVRAAVRLTCAAFDTYLHPAGAKHAIAV